VIPDLKFRGQLQADHAGAHHRDADQRAGHPDGQVHAAAVEQQRRRRQQQHRQQVEISFNIFFFFFTLAK